MPWPFYVLCGLGAAAEIVLLLLLADVLPF
jgi:hypothetical protein